MTELLTVSVSVYILHPTSILVGKLFGLWCLRLYLVSVHCSNRATISFRYAKPLTLHCIPDHSLVVAALHAGVPLSSETLGHQLQPQLLIAGAETIRQLRQDLVKPGEGFLLHRISETTNKENIIGLHITWFNLSCAYHVARSEM